MDRTLSAASSFNRACPSCSQLMCPHSGDDIVRTAWVLALSLCPCLVHGTHASGSRPPLHCSCVLCNPCVPLAFLGLRTLSPSGSKGQRFAACFPNQPSVRTQSPVQPPASCTCLTVIQRGQSVLHCFLGRSWLNAVDEAPFFWKASGSKYFRLRLPDGICCSNSTLLQQWESSQGQYVHEGMGLCSNKTLLTETCANSSTDHPLPSPGLDSRTSLWSEQSWHPAATGPRSMGVPCSMWKHHANR